MYLATMRALNPRALNVHVRCMVKLITADIVTAITDSNVRFPSVNRTRERSAYTPALIPSDVPPTTPNLNKFHTSLQRNSHVTFFSLRNLRIMAESVAGRRLTRPLVVDAEVGVTGLAASRSLNVMADHPVAPSRATSRTRLPSGPLTTSDAGRDGDAGSRASDQRPRADVPNGNAETSRRPFTSVTMRCPPPPRGANAAAPETDKRSSPVRYAVPYRP